jgi:hypothetical protein
VSKWNLCLFCDHPRYCHDYDTRDGACQELTCNCLEFEEAARAKIEREGNEKGASADV